MIERTVHPMVLRPYMTVLKDGRPHFVSCCDEYQPGEFKVGTHDCETDEWDDRYVDAIDIYWPSGGDAVRLTGDYCEAKVGDIGIIGGAVEFYQMDGSITFRYSAYRNHKEVNQRGREHVSVSGGPCPIGQDFSRLRWTGETLAVWFWRWNERGMGGGNGEEYQLEVPVWEWNGND